MPMKIKKISLKKTLISVSAIFFDLMLILNCQSVFQNSYGKDYHIYELTLVSAIFYAFVSRVCFKFSRRKIIKWKYITIAYLMFLSITMPFYVQGEALISFVARYFSFPIILYSFCTVNDCQELLLKRFIDLASIISAISIFFWLFGSVLNIIKPSGIFLFDWGVVNYSNNYYNLYFETQWVDWVSFILKRNTAIFVEGPMFSLVLMIAIMFQYILRDRIQISKKKFTIIIMGMLTTFSITGYIFVLVIFLVYLARKKKWKLFILSIGGPTFIFVLIKLLQLKSSSNSSSFRIQDYIIGFNAWIASPFIGHGYGNLDNIVAKFSNRPEVGFSNSFFAVLDQGGIFYFTIFLIPILLCLSNFFKKRRNKEALIVTLFYIYTLLTVVYYTAYINFLLWSIMILYDFTKNENQENKNVHSIGIYREYKLN